MSMATKMAREFVLQEDPEPREAFTAAEFFSNNEYLDDATRETILSLSCGGSATFDEGAGGRWTIRRVD